MLRAQGYLCTSEPIKGVIVVPRGIEIPDNVPVLDSHNVRNGCLGYLAEASADDDGLFGELIFKGRAGRRAYDRIERCELRGVSCSFDIRNVAIFNADGTALDVDEALDQRDDPDLIVVVQRSILREVSVCAVPADSGAIVRACSFESQCWQMIKQGEAELRRILRPDRDDDDTIFDPDGDGMVSIRMPDRKLTRVDGFVL